jgi:BASS family bile acid:Na+ symporter
MICFICPTAAAAGVITMKLGGNMAQTITYVILDNCMAAVLIPLVIPLVNPAEDISFMESFLRILTRVFSILLLPSILAWMIRYTWKKLHNFLLKYVGWAFYFWGISLFLSLTLATKALIISGIHFTMIIALGAVSLFCCLLQFWIGRHVGGKYYGRPIAITAGQSLGQKNSGFIVWLGFNYLTPVSSVAGGLYSIWHNIVNQWQLTVEAKRAQTKE